MYIVSIVCSNYTCMNKAFLTPFFLRNSLEVKFVLVLVDLVTWCARCPSFLCSCFSLLVIDVTDL